MTCLAFDIDGTIFDCGSIIVEAFQSGITEFVKNSAKDIRIPDKEKIISVLGIPTDTIFQELFPSLDNKEQQRMNNLCTESLVNMIKSGGGNIFNGVYSTLESLYNEGYRILAASNGRLQYIEAILKSNGLIDFFNKPIIVLNEEIKDKSEIVHYYKENLCRNDLLIMIGDRFSDKIAAEKNSIPFIGCLFGHAGNAELTGLKWITGEFASIYKLVKDIEKLYLNISGEYHEK